MINYKGLIIKEPWINLILQDKKTIEVRGHNTKIRGTIFLIRSGSGLIVGSVNLTDCKTFTLSDFRKNIDLHCIPEKQCNNLPYKNTFGWELKEPIIFKNPIPYEHKQGAIIWVNIEKYQNELNKTIKLVKYELKDETIMIPKHSDLYSINNL